MKITIENTSKIVELQINGGLVPARVWQGQTENGIPVQAFITRIAPEVPRTHFGHTELTRQFDRELRECADPRPSVDAIPLRLII
jgi:hypothetical protein